MTKMANCHSASTRKVKKQPQNGKQLTIALAGNANVGKSVIFNQLTRSNQIIGNWPGKTVERAEGKLCFDGFDIKIVDLPGIYSLSTFSPEELITREYISREKPDVVIDVIGSPVLERNLFFTLQLKEMEVPLVVCLNQVDVSEKKGMKVDTEKLQATLGVPVVPTVAIQGKGLHDLINKAVEVGCQRHQHRHRHRRGHQPSTMENPGQNTIGYSSELETKVQKLADLIESENLQLDYPSRWIAIKLLEGDTEITRQVAEGSEGLVRSSRTMAKEIEEMRNEPTFAVIASERYSSAHEITASVQKQDTVKATFSEWLDRLTTHKVTGYITSAVVLLGLLLWTFTVGNFLSTILSNAFSFFEPVDPRVTGPILGIIWNGVFSGLIAGITLVIPFVVPFYLMLAVMEDSGILTRVAFMLDSAMHKMGLHGKAIIPLILGYGCNVPAIYTTRILETRRERLLASFAVTFAPCAARTIVIFGLVAVFVGIQWALALYVIDLAIMFILARVALRVVPGKLSGLIMEMHSFKTPSLSIVAKQTWARTKSIIYMVFPIYVVGSTLVQGLYSWGALQPINNAMTFLTVGWLGLPAIAGILLIFGAVRKELILLMLVAIYGTELAAFLTPVQFIVLALVGTLYIPCIATIAALANEFGWKVAIVMSAANLATAVFVGGIASRALNQIL